MRFYTSSFSSFRTNTVFNRAKIVLDSVWFADSLFLLQKRFLSMQRSSSFTKMSSQPSFLLMVSCLTRSVDLATLAS